MRRLRLGDLHRLLQDRCRGSILPDDDAGRDYLRELLLPISIGPHEAVKRSHAIEVWGPTDRMRREIELWAPWMQEDEACLSPMWQRKPMARTLGDRLQVTFGERARLQLRTIGPCDMTEAAMAAIRKQKKRQRERLRRLSQGAKTRAEYLAASLSQTKPWLGQGVSRRTWERNGKPDVASPCQVNLVKTGHALATEEKHGSKASECGRVSTPTPAGLTETCAEFLTADEAAWLVDAMCRLSEPVGYGAAA
jgi:hypothetical protein